MAFFVLPTVVRRIDSYFQGRSPEIFITNAIEPSAKGRSPVIFADLYF